MDNLDSFKTCAECRKYPGNGRHCKYVGFNVYATTDATKCVSLGLYESNKRK